MVGYVVLYSIEEELMSWQDIVIMICVFWSAFALRHAIKDKTPPALKSARETTIIMLILAGTFLTMGLWLSVAAELFAAGAWGTLWLIAYKQKIK